MKIGIACDHAGYELKSYLIENLQNDNLQFLDFGCFDGKNSVDYPDIATNLCQKYLNNEFNFGILICGSGIGISIAANRFLEIRAALCHNQEIAALAREHNDANILCLGARILEPKIAIEITKTFLNTKFAGGRHQSRVNKLSQCKL